MRAQQRRARGREGAGCGDRKRCEGVDAEAGRCCAGEYVVILPGKQQGGRAAGDVEQGCRAGAQKQLSLFKSSGSSFFCTNLCKRVTGHVIIIFL